MAGAWRCLVVTRSAVVAALAVVVVARVVVARSPSGSLRTAGLFTLQSNGLERMFAITIGVQDEGFRVFECTNKYDTVTHAAYVDSSKLGGGNPRLLTPSAAVIYEQGTHLRVAVTSYYSDGLHVYEVEPNDEVCAWVAQEPKPGRLPASCESPWKYDPADYGLADDTDEEEPDEEAEDDDADDAASRLNERRATGKDEARVVEPPEDAEEEADESGRGENADAEGPEEPAGDADDEAELSDYL